MAERRMFSKTIIDSDVFLDMPQSTQSLYFHLGMRADDDGFINNPRKIMRMVGASEDDFKILIAKRYILTFESGVIVIKHWKMHNYIQKDRYKPTVYTKEKKLLSLNENKSYTDKKAIEIKDVYNMDTVYPERVQDVSIMDSQVRLGKVSIGKDRDRQRGGVLEAETEEKTDTGRIRHPDTLITEILEKTKSMKSLPTERRMILNIPNIGELKDAISLYTEEEIISALDNYEYVYQHRNEYRYFAYKDVVNFLTNGGLQNFTDESNPLERYRQGGSYQDTEGDIQTEFDEVVF